MPLIIKQVPSLFRLCGKTIEEHLLTLSSNFLENTITFSEYLDNMRRAKATLSQTPPLLQHEIGRHCLVAADRLTTKQYFSETGTADQTAIEQLVSIAAHLKIKKLHFSEWSNSVQSYLFKFLQRFTSLEDLNFDVIDESMCLQPIDFCFLPNLKNFSYLNNYADNFMISLCLNCRLLQSVFLKISPESTAKTNQTLAVCCKYLQSINLYICSDGSMDDFVQVFLNSHSNSSVSKIGEKVYLHGFLEKLEAKVVPFRTFNLQKLIGAGVSEKLTLIPKYFPYLRELELEADIDDFTESDFSCLESLENLKVFKLQLCIFEDDDLPQFFALITSSVLTSLDFEFFEDFELKINITDFLNVGSRCPNLEHLKLSKFSFFKDANILAVESVKPFSKLRNFEFNSSSVLCLDYVLRYALNIESIRLKITNDLTDEFMTSVFTFNPLKHLKELDFSPENSVSIRMLKYIIINCKQISFLGHFIQNKNAPTDDELDTFKQFLIEHNVNVDFR